MTDEQFKQLMEKLEAILRAIPKPEPPPYLYAPPPPYSTWRPISNSFG